MLLLFWMAASVVFGGNEPECQEHGTNDFVDPFADMYPGGVAPSWPDGFGDRLEVMKFKFVKNATTGQPMLVDDADFV